MPKTIDNAGSLWSGPVIFPLHFFPRAPSQDPAVFSECYEFKVLSASTESEADPVSAQHDIGCFDIAKPECRSSRAANVAGGAPRAGNAKVGDVIG